MLGGNRLVTLTGAGGSGKTRLAIQVAHELDDHVGYVDLAPITDSELVPVAVIRALGLPDQPGRTGTNTLRRFIADRTMLLLLDNCEHLLDASGELIATLLDACPRLTVLTTSREPIGLDGEVTWRVPSLSLTDEAVELFTDRARRVRSGFTATDSDAATVIEICKRLDGMPLAIELAAARVRSLSLNEILDGLHDRFRLLTGGSRRAVRRQQSLGASVDWSHALLTESERILFRRLAAFMGGFDLAAAQEVCSGDGLPRHQILDQLALLVDKSLVVAETSSGATRYRLLETIRQYALEKLGESGEADAVRDHHRDHYTSMALGFDAVTPADYEPLLSRAEIEIDNLRAAFAWSIEHGQLDRALELVCALHPLWQLRGRPQEGLTWFDTAFNEMDAWADEIDPAVRARALADNAVLRSLTASISGIPQAEKALAIARELDDRALIARALTACIGAAAFDIEAGRPYVAEAIEVARELGDKWRLSQILAWQAYRAGLTGHPVIMAAAGEEGQALADEVGDWFISRMCRFWGSAVGRFERGAVGEAAALLRELLSDADASSDMFHSFICRVGLGNALLLMGQYDEARVFAQQAVDAAPELGPFLALWAYAPLARVALMQGDMVAAAAANDVVLQQIAAQPEVVIANVMPMVEFAFVQGDLTTARARADETVSVMTGWHRASALVTRAHVALAQGELNRAEADARDALISAVEIEAFQVVPDALEILVEVGGAAANHRDAARLAGASSAIRRAQGGTVRLRIYDPPYEAALAAIREALGAC
nr:AAA family ATPase [Mycolicibacterium agri]